MAKLKSITIENFRSIKEPVTIKFPDNQPVVLIGENNSGKTNIIRALDIMFGDFHPKYKDFDDHDYYGRNPGNNTIIKIEAETEGLKTRLGQQGQFSCKGFKLEKKKNVETNYAAIQDNNFENIYVPNILREELSTVLVSSEQNLSYQLSYASKYTLLSKVTKAFHDKLTSDEDRKNRLQELYKQTLNIFDEVKEFKNFRDSMSSITGTFIQNMTHALQLDFSAYDPSNYFKNLKVQPTDGKNTLNFEELGTGQQQILALSFAHAYAKCFKDKSSLILILDEPEAHLHPLAQKWLARTLFSMVTDGLQIVITTHSPYFIDLNYLEGLYLVRKENNATKVINKSRGELAKFCTETGATKANEQTIIQFFSKSATSNILKGLFASKVVLVEGMTEELTLPIYLEKVELDVLKEGIDIIGVGGKGELAKWWRLFTLFEIPCFIYFDNDIKDDKDGVKRKDALKSIGIHDEEIERLISSEDWNIEEKFCVFGKDFEETLRKTFSDYEGIEKKVKDELGDSKPLVAREVAREICAKFNSDDNSWDNFKKLKKNIEDLKL
jgi:putative ATP-dependent endonuclease of OLD family